MGALLLFGSLLAGAPCIGLDAAVLERRIALELEVLARRPEAYELDCSEDVILVSVLWPEGRRTKRMGAAASEKALALVVGQLAQAGPPSSSTVVAEPEPIEPFTPPSSVQVGFDARASTTSSGPLLGAGGLHLWLGLPWGGFVLRPGFDLELGRVGVDAAQLRYLGLGPRIGLVRPFPLGKAWTFVPGLHLGLRFENLEAEARDEAAVGRSEWVVLAEPELQLALMRQRGSWAWGGALGVATPLPTPRTLLGTDELTLGPLRLRLGIRVVWGVRPRP
ncbi:MAG: hypothetical protein AAGD10_04215 [Myxococcota bacterium]